MTSRGVAPVIGIVLLVGVTVLLAGAVLVLGSLTPEAAVPQATIEGTVDPETDVLTLEHAGGDPLSVSSIELHVTVDGEPLRHQPPVPFSAAKGFNNSASGPFTDWSDDVWAAGERGTIELAGTNEPLPGRESSVSVRIAVEGGIVAETELEVLA